MPPWTSITVGLDEYESVIFTTLPCKIWRAGSAAARVSSPTSIPAASAAPGSHVQVTVVSLRVTHLGDGAARRARG
jgi:hypothetical protein